MLNSADQFADFLATPRELTAAHRPLRLQLACAEGSSDQLLLPQRISGEEAICGGIEYRLQCVATDASLPLKRFIAVPAALHLVTDRGQLHSVCGIVAEAAAGQSDGGLATYQLVLRDALSLMEKRINTRVFRSKSELQILDVLFTEWRLNNTVLAATFEYEVLTRRALPPREFTMQYNESDAAFIRRLLRRRGIAWYFKQGRPANAAPERDDFPHHTMVLFDDAAALPENAAGTVRYHRDHATEERDTITAWNALRTLQSGSVTRYSWDYGTPRNPEFMFTRSTGLSDQGGNGNRFAASLDDYQSGTPHMGDSNDDLRRLGQLRMARLDYETKCFQGEGGVRDLRVGEWFSLTEHPEIDQHPAAERNFVVTALAVHARNNLPKGLDARIDRLFQRNGWQQDETDPACPAGAAMRYHNRFSCVRRGIDIVPACDAAADLPYPRLLSAVVVGPAGEEVYCDALGRIKVRFVATREADHRHADGAGASDTEADTAWLRVATPWAGNGPGSGHQCGALTLPRIGSEVLVDFLGGDPDRPIIVGQLYNAVATPPGLSAQGQLPGNRYLSGLRSREIRGERANQLCFDDTSGQISAQVASGHAASQLNLGFLTAPRHDGDAAARGQGFELRSDASGAIRAARTLLISAWQRLDASGTQMSGDESLALMTECLELFKSLGQYAAAHQAQPIDEAPATDLKTSLDAALGADAASAASGKPAISLTAPAGLALSTPKTVVSYAGVNIDTVAQQHLQFTAGQRCNVNAGAGVSLFAHQGGITHIAHHGPFLMQSQHDKMQLDAAQDLGLSAGKHLLGQAGDEITLMTSGGAYIRLSGGNVELGGPGPLTIKTNGHHWNGPASMKAELPSFSDGALRRTPRLLSPLDEQPVDGMSLHIERGDGSAANSTSGKDGRGSELTNDTLERAIAYLYSKRT